MWSIMLRGGGGVVLAYHATAGVAAPPAYTHTQHDGTKESRNMLIMSRGQGWR